MINYDNLNRQHATIMNEIDFIENELNKGKISINISDTALHISKLAGLLKIHLLEEDKFLYPNLLNNSDEEMKKLTEGYNQEMGNIAEDYTVYKNSYNVASKISKDLDQFVIDSKRILKILKERMSKEDKELYYKARLKNL